VLSVNSVRCWPVAFAKSGAPIYVDYAHTPDSLEKILEALRPHTAGQLHVVFGCGGDRDKGKRPIMGAIAVKLADDGVHVGQLFRYALRNLLVNSVRHGGAGQVEVTVRSSVDRAGTRKIEVTDNGPGVPDEMKSGVFRREGRPGQVTGLYLVKRIISRYGGRVWIEDRVPGNPAKGARFVITLPL
jgi:signal transduction histidine kinase